MMESCINATTTTTTASASVRLGIQKSDYVAHWIKINSYQEDAKMIAEYALQCKRLKQMPLSTPRLTELTTPEKFWIGETNRQFWTALEVAGSFGHFWAMGNQAHTIKDVIYDICDSINRGCNDWYNQSSHDEPTPADESASRRFMWEVFPNGSVLMEIKRPSGVVCSIRGMINSDFLPEVRIDPRLIERRHLHCLAQRLVLTFGLSEDRAIQAIEESRDFSKTGYRFGEIASFNLQGNPPQVEYV